MSPSSALEKADLAILARVKAAGSAFMMGTEHRARAEHLVRAGYLTGELALYATTECGSRDYRSRFTLTARGKSALAEVQS